MNHVHRWMRLPDRKRGRLVRYRCECGERQEELYARAADVPPRDSLMLYGVTGHHIGFVRSGGAL